MKTVGIYITPPRDDEQHHYAFYKACGYNYLEFCDLGFSQRPDLLPAYHASLTRAVETARKAGFEVWILLLAGMKQWNGPGPAGDPGTFSALDKAQLKARLDQIEATVRAARGADGFTFFAGDPGGDPEGRSTIHDCLDFCRQVQQRVKTHAPAARFSVNVWAIAEWSGFPSPFRLDFWRKQVVNARAVAEEPELLGPDCGIAFSMDNYYRSLTLRCYDDAGEAPVLYPTRADVAAAKRRGAQPVLGWPYFLVDECDDGFITPNNVVTKGQSQAETRYIRSVVDHGRALGLDGLVTNAAFPAAEALNVWAFGRMCRDSRLTPERALDGYAALIATPTTRGALAQVLRFVENHSNWDNSLPPGRRLPPLPCPDAPDAAAALALLDRVRPRKSSPIPLPDPPPVVLARYRRRVEAIGRGEIGGFAKLPGAAG